jgi:hypothetical protein
MKVLKETKYLKFVLNSRIPGKKTDVVEVINVHHFFTIGYIKWYSKWRQYCFFPLGETIWNKDCLKDVNEIINTMTLKHGDEKLQRDYEKR